jgi:glycerophosphoryl diester phosphodiesterase
MSLCPEILSSVSFAPTAALLPIARLNVNRLSAIALRENYGGITGHYLFMTNALLRKHRARGQKAGTGYVCSKNCLFRELNRGVDWIFSDNAVELQAIIHKTRKRAH